MATANIAARNESAVILQFPSARVKRSESEQALFEDAVRILMRGMPIITQEQAWEIVQEHWERMRRTDRQLSTRA